MKASYYLVHEQNSLLEMIRIENLNFWYEPSTSVLNNLSLHVPEGSIYGFIGSNGAGKSTAIRCILGLLKPKSGSISVFDLDQPVHRRSIIKKTGYLVEGPHFYSNLTCFENLKLLSFHYQFEKNRLEFVLKKMGLWEYKDRLYGKCSTGMKQRLGIAKSFLSNPRLLILDEPLNGLDPEWIVELRIIIKELNINFGTTVFLSSHLLSELEKVVTHIGMLKNGQLEFEGIISQFLTETKSKQIFITVQSIENITKIENTPGITLKGHHGNNLEFIVEKNSNLNKFLQNIISADVDILDIKTSELGLEDTYLKNNIL